MSPVGLAAIRPIVAAYLIGFGVFNQMRRQTGYFPYAPAIPARATVISGIFVIAAGVGTLLKREWAMVVGAVLCLMHLTVSAVTWPLSAEEGGYIVLCAVRVFGSLVMLLQTRKHAAAEKGTGGGDESGGSDHALRGLRACHPIRTTSLNEIAPAHQGVCQCD